MRDTYRSSPLVTLKALRQPTPLPGREPPPAPFREQQEPCPRGGTRVRPHASGASRPPVACAAAQGTASAASPTVRTRTTPPEIRAGRECPGPVIRGGAAFSRFQRALSEARGVRISSVRAVQGFYLSPVRLGRPRRQLAPRCHPAFAVSALGRVTPCAFRSQTSPELWVRGCVSNASYLWVSSRGRAPRVTRGLRQGGRFESSLCPTGGLFPGTSKSLAAPSYTWHGPRPPAWRAPS